MPYLSYAIFAAERYDWLYHERQKTGQFPSTQEECDWIKRLPESYFVRVEKQALDWLDVFSKDYLKDFIEESKSEAIEQSINSDIQRLGRFWPNFFNNVLGGFFATLLFVLFSFGLVVSVSGDFSFLDFLKRATDSTSP